ncbi:hypothetical protein WG899_20180 [Paucibacter sp. AS339]|uniref:hypothetical protein n=1 Tax=Paucibacter hankyongi TaxID=3133434 RepID=UPI0030B6DDC9
MSLIREVQQRLTGLFNYDLTARFGRRRGTTSAPTHDAACGDERHELGHSQAFLDTDIAVTWLYEACNSARHKGQSQSR